MPDLKPFTKGNIEEAQEMVNSAVYSEYPVYEADPYWQYLKHYLRCQRRYVEHVQICLSNGNTPISWELFASVYIINQE